MKLSSFIIVFRKIMKLGDLSFLNVTSVTFPPTCVFKNWPVV